MKKGKSGVIIAVVIVIIIIIVAIVWLVVASRPINAVSYSCKNGKSIDAKFYKDRVDLTLSDDRQLTLPQAVSASGARYANDDESIVFWEKGDTAFITESDKETFKDCKSDS